MTKTYKNIICDLDGTLLECAKYYLEVQNNFADFQHKRTGLPWDVCLNLLKKIDIECTNLPDAFNAERFPRSFQATSVALDVLARIPPNAAAAIESFYIGDAVFTAEYPLYNGVRETLDLYHNAGAKLFVLTKGDMSVQQRKLNINGLLKYFDSSNTYIVPTKGAQEVATILYAHGLKPEETIMVGDSERDDIGSATRAGIDSVLVSTGTRWGYEDGHGNKPTYHIPSFADLPSVVPVPTYA